MQNIYDALERITGYIMKILPKSTVKLKKGEAKLIISEDGVIIKVEVNTINRGILGDPIIMTLCENAQKQFEVFSAIKVVSLAQLFGGKIVAALDRQHPRDLFDVKYLLEKEGFSEEIKKGFILLLICSERPIHEILFPRFQDRRLAMDNQFSGMSDEEFTYEEYENVRAKLVQVIYEKLTQVDKDFLLSINNLNPDWSKYNFENFPAVKWKLQNLQKLKDTNPTKYHKMCNALEKNFSEMDKFKYE